MKRFFEHVFYRIYWWNTKVVSNLGSPVFPTLLGISILHIINISSIILLLLVVLEKDLSYYPKWLHMVGMGLVFLADYFVYIHDGRLKRTIEKVKQVSSKEMKRNDLLTVLYILFSIILLLYSVIEMRGVTLGNSFGT